MFLFSRIFDQPVYAWHQRRYRHGIHALDVLWYDPRGTDEQAKGLPRHVWFKNIDVAFLRSAWEDPDAWFVGFKGGDNKANHSHLDLGTFVLETAGKRWAVELGSDNYNLPGYLGKQRWTYYRLRTEGQNTLVINGENQDADAAAPIVAFESTPERAFAVADLTAAYAKSAKRVHRGVALIDERQVLVQDEIETERPLDVEWIMHTPADVSREGDLGLLTLGDDKLWFSVDTSTEFSWEAEPASPPPPQRPLKNICRIVVRLRPKPGETRITIMFAADEAVVKPTRSAPIRPLSKW